MKKEENIYKKKVDYIYTRTEEIITWDNLTEENLTIFIEGIRKPRNVIEPRDGIQIRGLRKEPLVRQLIDALLICGYEQPEHEVQLIQEMEIHKLTRSNNVIVQKDGITISGAKREANIRQPINQLFIAALTNREEESQRREEEYRKIHQEILKTVQIEEFQKKTRLQTQAISELNILGFEMPDNVIVPRDSVQIRGFEKERLIRQPINELNIIGFEKDENTVQRIEELEIIDTEKVIVKNSIVLCVEEIM